MNNFNVQNEELYDAASIGNMAMVVAALDKGLDVNWEVNTFSVIMHLIKLPARA